MKHLLQLLPLFYHSQESVYESVEPVVSGALQGYNGVVFAYGQSGAGKSFSIGSASDVAGTSVSEADGILPRTIRTLLDGTSAACGDVVSMAFLEIYKEQVRDCLSTSNSSAAGLAVRESTAGITVQGLSWHEITGDATRAMQLISQGNAARAVGATELNAHSSRSHLICSLRVSKGIESTDAVLHIVDLAGSERQKRSKAEGGRLKEAVHINSSLLALGNVINALATKKAFVPYRDSVLTRLLSPALGGNARTAMLTCVSPAEADLDESMNSLRYACRARTITNTLSITRATAKPGSGGAGGISAEREAQLLARISQLEAQASNQHAGGNTAISAAAAGPAQPGLTPTGAVASADDTAALLEMTSLEATRLAQQLVAALQDRDSWKAQAMQAAAEQPHAWCAEDSEHEEASSPAAKARPASDGDVEEQAAIEVCAVPSSDAHVDANSTTEDDMDLLLQRQHGLRQELQELSGALEAKQELLTKLQASNAVLGSAAAEYEATLERMSGRVTELIKEREQLKAGLVAPSARQPTPASSAPASTALPPTHSTEASAAVKTQLAACEAELDRLQQQLREANRLSKAKVASGTAAEALMAEMKQLRVARTRLERELRETSKQWRAYKLARDREVRGLQRESSKAEARHKKLQTQHEKTLAVLQRRTEELAAKSKRQRGARQELKAGPPATVSSILTSSEPQLVTDPVPEDAGLLQALQRSVVTGHGLPAALSMALSTELQARVALSKSNSLLRNARQLRESPGCAAEGSAEELLAASLRSTIASLRGAITTGARVHTSPAAPASAGMSWRKLAHDLPTTQRAVAWLLDVVAAHFAVQASSIAGHESSLAKARADLQQTQAELAESRRAEWRAQRQAHEAAAASEEKVMALLAARSAAASLEAGSEPASEVSAALQAQVDALEATVRELRKTQASTQAQLLTAHERSLSLESQLVDTQRELALEREIQSSAALWSAQASTRAKPHRAKPSKSQQQVDEAAAREVEQALAELSEEDTMADDSSDSDWEMQGRSSTVKRGRTTRARTRAAAKRAGQAENAEPSMKASEPMHPKQLFKSRPMQHPVAAGTKRRRPLGEVAGNRPASR